MANNPKTRWPKTQADYDLKLDKTVEALDELIFNVGKPDIFFFCEITSNALLDVRNRVFPDYHLVSLDFLKSVPTLQIGVLYNKNKTNIKFIEQPPITVPSTPTGTRSMVVVDAVAANFKIRFIGCHWTSRFDGKNSHKTRFRIADHLSKDVYQFLEKDRTKHHVVIVGDLNEEPFDENMEAIYAHRHRARSKASVHKADRAVERAHMYNTSWRLLGERIPHSNANAVGKFQDCAGTFYWESERTWHNFDHVIVSGGLLQSTLPCLNEEEVHVVSTPKFLTNGVPLKFRERKGVYAGLSDHLPLLARIYI